MTKEHKIIFSITLVVIIGLVFIMTLGPNTSPSTLAIDTSSLVASTSHMTGKLGAKVTVVEFGDYECPACAALEPTIKQLKELYATSSDFNLVFRNFPLSQHANALISAEAAEAAGAQGKFWDMHDLLYQNQNDWADSGSPITFFVQYAKQIGLDVTVFQSDIQKNAYQNIISGDQAAGNAVNVQWTPSIYINGQLQQSSFGPEQILSTVARLMKP